MHQFTPIAQAALLLYVPFVVVVFQLWERVQATAIALLVGVLFLPELVEFDPPLLPPFDKFSISTLAVMVAARAKMPPGFLKPKTSALYWIAIGLLLAGNVGTVVTNRDSLVLSAVVVKGGLTYQDLLGLMARSLLFIILPFGLGRSIFSSREGLTILLRMIVLFGIVYGFLMLVEIRLSPQLNNWVYGFHQHEWRQAVRDGGFRPIVFMAHGLATSLYCVTAILAAITLKRMGQRFGPFSYGHVALFLFGVLALSNSLGALLYGVVLAPILWIGRPRLLSFIASMMALFVMLIPILRINHALPLDELVAYIADYNEGRAQSLGFRFGMEELLLEKWSDRPLFGFGGYGRDRIFDDEGNNIIVMDSAWIIALLQRGWFGFLGQFLLLTFPIWKARKFIAQFPDPVERNLFSGLVMIVAVNTFDLVINGLFSYLPLLLAGALYGYATRLGKPVTVGNQAVAPSLAPAPRGAIAG